MDLLKRLEELKTILKIDEKRKKVDEIEKEMRSPSFWLDEKNSREQSQKLKNLKEEIKDFNDVYEMAQISNEEELKAFEKEIEKLETHALFTGKHDDKNAIINFYSGAGGVDAQDWTEMLLSMYTKWADISGHSSSLLSMSKGAEAGIKNATLEIRGDKIFGKLRGEDGVHRLVRQSPFNAKNLRQTSFSLVEVMPEIEEEKELIINDKDLRVDTFRSSGHGGQSVNTTDSAVRITHIPTGIVSSCQNERSQLQNRETAMKILRSRLADLMLKQHKEKISDIKGDFSSPEWGNQIRSYILHPYKLVKDHRTGYESKDPGKVLSGEINDFIEAELKYFQKQ